MKLKPEPLWKQHPAVYKSCDNGLGVECTHCHLWPQGLTYKVAFKSHKSRVEGPGPIFTGAFLKYKHFILENV